MRSPIILPLVLCCTAVSARAALIAYDAFNYTTGAALGGQNGGTGWNGAWTSNGAGSVVVTPGLTYSDGSLSLVTSGNSGQFAGGDNGNVRLPTLTPETAGSTLYISFIAKMTNPAGGYAGFSLFEGGNELMFLGDTNGPTTWGIDPKSGTVANGTTSVSTQAFLVFKIDFFATTADVRLFENPSLSVEPANGAAAASTSRNLALTWDRIRMQSNHAGVIDEVRIGTTYADVTPSIPEPGVGVSGLLGLSSLVAVRRRR